MDLFVDTHCHLDFDDFATDRDQILTRATQAGVSKIITIGIDFPSSRRAIDLAKDNGHVHATVGIHPHNACHLAEKDIQELMALARKAEVVAYGEIGLDFYRNYQPRSTQISCLREHPREPRGRGVPGVGIVVAPLRVVLSNKRSA